MTRTRVTRMSLCTTYRSLESCHAAIATAARCSHRTVTLHCALKHCPTPSTLIYTVCCVVAIDCVLRPRPRVHVCKSAKRTIESNKPGRAAVGQKPASALSGCCSARGFSGARLVVNRLAGCSDAQAPAVRLARPAADKRTASSVGERGRAGVSAHKVDVSSIIGRMRCAARCDIATEAAPRSKTQMSHPRQAGLGVRYWLTRATACDIFFSGEAFFPDTTTHFKG
jgi:hypothetical protein